MVAALVGDARISTDGGRQTTRRQLDELRAFARPTAP